jgi:hypothetical protein
LKTFSTLFNSFQLFKNFQIAGGKFMEKSSLKKFNKPVVLVERHTKYATVTWDSGHSELIKDGDFIKELYSQTVKKLVKKHAPEGYGDYGPLRGCIQQIPINKTDDFTTELEACLENIVSKVKTYFTGAGSGTLKRRGWKSDFDLERYPECRFYERCLNQHAFTSVKGWDCSGCQRFTPGYRSSYEDLRPYLSLLIDVFKPKWRKEYNQQVARLREKFGQRYEHASDDDDQDYRVDGVVVMVTSGEASAKRGGVSG